MFSSDRSSGDAGAVAVVGVTSVTTAENTPVAIVSPQPGGPSGVGANFGAAGYVLLVLAVFGLLLALACVHALGRWRRGSMSRLLGTVLAMLGVSLLSRAVLNMCIAFEANGPVFVIILLEFAPVTLNDATALLILNYAATEATAENMKGAKINATTKLLNARGISAELSGRLGIAVGYSIAFLVGSMVALGIIAADPSDIGYLRLFPVAEMFVSGAGFSCLPVAAVHTVAFFRGGFEMSPRPAHLVRIVCFAMAGVVVRASVNLSDALMHWNSDDNAVITVWVLYFMLFEAVLVVDVLRYAKRITTAGEAVLDIPDSRRCRHCHEKEVQVLFHPCMHLATCAACAEIVKQCPVCRNTVQESIHISYE